MTNEGGNSRRVIFSFDPSSSTYTKVFDFDYYNYYYTRPFGGLIQASDGKLYGMTSEGGSNDGYGHIFSFDPSSSTFRKLKNVAANESGSRVGASVMQATDGKLYGMTSGGGSNGVGVIFSFDPSSSTFKKIFDFDGTNGGNPSGSLLQAGDGMLYGITTGGGSAGYGVIFSFDPSSSTYKKMFDFDFDNGTNPSGSLIQGSDGKLYAMTVGYDPGEESSAPAVIFSFDPSSSTFKKVFDLGSFHPLGSLVRASDGKLYGMTYYGGTNGAGVIFSFDPSSSTYKKNLDFDGTNGAHPRGSLMQASDEKLYGMTNQGGSNDSGVIFSFNPSSFTYKKTFDFEGTNGAKPSGSLMQASDGKLYGMTSEGGSNGKGAIFSYDPSTSTYTKLKDYNGVNGANPGIGSAFIEAKDNQNKARAVTLSTPFVKYAVAASIKVDADATDTDGTISKVEFIMVQLCFILRLSFLMVTGGKGFPLVIIPLLLKLMITVVM